MGSLDSIRKSRRFVRLKEQLDQEFKAWASITLSGKVWGLLLLSVG
jgi:hypothetical protein